MLGCLDECVCRARDEDVIKATREGRTRKYGGLGTIHQVGEVDVELGPDGNVAAVWFRCMLLPFTQVRVGAERAAQVSAGRDKLPKIVSIEVVSD